MFLRIGVCAVLLGSLAGCATTASQCNASDSSASLIAKLNCDYGGGYAEQVRNSEQDLVAAREQNRQFNQVYDELNALQVSTRQDLATQQRQQASLEKSLNGLLANLKARHANKSDVQQQVVSLEQQLKSTKSAPAKNASSAQVEARKQELKALQQQVSRLQLSLGYE
jgi:chromosome segregation ATPase